MTPTDAARIQLQALLLTFASFLEGVNGYAEPEGYTRVALLTEELSKAVKDLKPADPPYTPEEPEYVELETLPGCYVRENQAHLAAQERERTRELPEVVAELERRVLRLEEAVLPICVEAERGAGSDPSWHSDSAENLAFERAGEERVRARGTR